MQLIKKTGDYAIYRKANKRYAVKDASRNWVNGDAKIEILKAEGLIKAPVPKPAPEPAAEPEAEAPAEATDGEPSET